MHTYSDEKLIKMYLKGKEMALEILVGRYLKPIYNFVYKLVGNADATEDIVQEVFVKVWQNFKSYKKQYKFKAWIYRIARNTAIDYLRKKRAVPFSEFNNNEGGNLILDTLADSNPLADKVFEQKEAKYLINLALRKLSSKHIEVFRLRHNNDLTFKEIAVDLGESLNTVKSRYRRALIRLRGIL